MNPSNKENFPGNVVTERVVLTSAQVKALRATPIEIIKGVPGHVPQLISATLKLDYGGTNAFTETADNLVFRLTNTSGAILSQTVEMTGFIDQTADTVTSALPKIDAIATSAAATGASVVLHNTGDGEIAGNAANDNRLSVVVSYVLHETL